MFFKDILKKVLLTESVTVNDINNVIDGHQRVFINYRSRGEDAHTGKRVIEVYAYGLTKKGNPVIRAFQPFGDTTTKVPSWKFFRIDRIIDWKPTNQTFSRPASFYYKNLGEFNTEGDKTMSVVYKIASFDSNDDNSVINKQGPKMKANKPDTKTYKTDTEIRMERLKQQLSNPIKLSDLKTKEALKNDTKPESGPKMKPKKNEPEIYKTDSEKNMRSRLDNLRRKISNPLRISDIRQNNNLKNKDVSRYDIEKLRDKLGDTSEPIKFSDLNDRLKGNNAANDKNEPEISSRENVEDMPQWKKDAYDRLEPLRRQLQNNPRKIDLSKIPRR